MEFNDVERIRQAVPEVEVITPNISRWGSTAIFRRQEKLLCRQRIAA